MRQNAVTLSPRVGRRVRAELLDRLGSVKQKKRGKLNGQLRVVSAARRGGNVGIKRTERTYRVELVVVVCGRVHGCWQVCTADRQTASVLQGAEFK